MTQQAAATTSTLRTRPSALAAAARLARDPSVERRTGTSVPVESAKVQAILGIGLFVLLTFGPSWTLVAYFGRPWPLGSNVPSRLLGVVLPYVIVMGWQPIGAAVAIRACAERNQTIDSGLRLGVARSLTLAVAGAIASGGAALLVAWLVSTAPQPWFVSLASRFPNTSSNLSGPMSTACLVIAVLLVSAQAIGEEVGFRDSLLRRSVLLCGSRLGVVLEAFLWGLWYAPVILQSRHGSFKGAIVSDAMLVVTYLLLGAVLGCLRLVAATIAPSTVACLLLMLGAGLPFVLSGLNVSLDIAIYQPAGWLPLLLILLGIRYAGISLVLGDRWFQQKEACLRVGTGQRPRRSRSRGLLR